MPPWQLLSVCMSVQLCPSRDTCRTESLGIGSLPDQSGHGLNLQHRAKVHRQPGGVGKRRGPVGRRIAIHGVRPPRRLRRKRTKPWPSSDDDLSRAHFTNLLGGWRTLRVRDTRASLAPPAIRSGLVGGECPVPERAAASFRAPRLRTITVFSCTTLPSCTSRNRTLPVQS